MTVLLVCSAVLVGYRVFEPEYVGISDTPEYLQTLVSYGSLREYTLSSGPSSIHYYYFCSVGNDDCEYVETTVIKSAARTTGIDLAALIEYVDISELENSLKTNRLKSDWGIGSYPALAAARTSGSEILIENILEWDTSSPLSETDLIRWLILNRLYDGSGIEAIETPAS